ncbi:MAG: hypothetical protein ABSA23_09410 [Anaerolineales bacterium]
MKTIFRLSTLFVLIAVQALVPVAAQARAQTPAVPSSMPPALYSAFLDASAKNTPAFQPEFSGYSLQTGGLRAELNVAGLTVARQRPAGPAHAARHRPVRSIVQGQPLAQLCHRGWPGPALQ